MFTYLVYGTLIVVFFEMIFARFPDLWRIAFVRLKSLFFHTIDLRSIWKKEHQFRLFREDNRLWFIFIFIIIWPLYLTKSIIFTIISSLSDRSWLKVKKILTNQ